MKNKIKKYILYIIKNEKGASEIVEATIVFPIMFFVLFFLIFFGNAYFVKANVDSIVAQAALEGAQMAQDPYMEYVNGKVKAENLGEVEVTPYRYLFGNMDTKEGAVASEVREKIKASGGLFKGMDPKIENTDIAKFNNKVLYSTFIVKVRYKVKFPWRFIFIESPTILDFSSRAEEPVNDTVEFIRNTDMVMDMLDGSETYHIICDKFNKIKSVLNELAAKG